MIFFIYNSVNSPGSPIAHSVKPKIKRINRMKGPLQTLIVYL
jgi:hypothetical protein